MKVGIIGLGFVGNALANSLTNSVKILKIDPKLNNHISDLKLFSPEIIFVCVPTPMKSSGGQDITILNDVFSALIKNNLECPIVLKSTLLPMYINEILDLVPDLVYNPEFLREKHADSDFKNAKFHIFGGKKDKCKFVSDFFHNSTHSNQAEHIFMDITAASFYKYTLNTFLSLKLTFFNELFDLFNTAENQLSWDEFINLLKKDSRMGDSHMNVPGHDGRRGFGGACFPKDSNAFHNYSVKQKSELSLLKKAIDINNQYRTGYNEPTDREKEQNITFDKND